jgi:hypothetical protein
LPEAELVMDPMIHPDCPVSVVAGMPGLSYLWFVGVKLSANRVLLLNQLGSHQHHEVSGPARFATNPQHFLVLYEKLTG